MKIIPVELQTANDFVRAHHRHSRQTVGHKFSIGVEFDGKLCGVAIVGRPIARHLDDGMTLEVLRVCTDGTRNACSALYGAARRAAKALGYARVVTYTLKEEGGASLRASGWRCDGEAGKPARHWHSRDGRRVEPVGNDLIGGKFRWSA